MKKEKNSNICLINFEIKINQDANRMVEKYLLSTLKREKAHFSHLAFFSTEVYSWEQYWVKIKWF